MKTNCMLAHLSLRNHAIMPRQGHGAEYRRMFFDEQSQAGKMALA